MGVASPLNTEFGLFSEPVRMCFCPVEAAVLGRLRNFQICQELGVGVKDYIKQPGVSVYYTLVHAVTLLGLLES
jgi:hypothetical protein